MAVGTQVGTQITAVEERVRARRRWWRPRRTSVVDEHAVLRRLDATRQVLEHAHTVVAGGWVQNRWYVTSQTPGSRWAGMWGAGPDDVTAACLVGALVLGLREHDPRADLLVDGGPALDVVWDAMQAGGGRPGPEAARRAWARDTRLLRVRDLTRWNDHPGRTRDEVLTLLDDAVDRVIMAAMHRPAVSA